MDTIAAIATAMTNSGIGIVRISGEQAFEVADRMISLKQKNVLLSDCASHTIHYGFVREGDKVVDEVIVLLMRAPRSYTTEDTVEIDCHGGALVVRRVLELAIKHGARPAEPGEFTKRAFLNGRIDLAQAESVIDLINAKNDFALHASVKQLNGMVSQEISALRASILHEVAFIESAIDDPEHYQVEGYGGELLGKINQLKDRMERLLKNAEHGCILREGINTVIVGKPNSGKSSLLNALVGRDRAIVTDIAGTTRDAIEEQITLNGITLNIIDTAGIRSTDDVVEKIGVDRAQKYLEEADLVLYVVDVSVPLDANDEKILAWIREKKLITLFNKSDLEPVVKEEDINCLLDQTILSVSAKYQEGLDQLVQTIEKMFFEGEIEQNDELYLTSARHKVLLEHARDSLSLVVKSIQNQMPEDFYTIDLMHAYEELGKITGESVEDDLVNEIFSKFCMGK